MKHVVIGSRGSDLALWQANHVKGQLEKLGCSVTIKIIKTQGDQIQHLSFDKLEGKGFFTKEIEEALLSGDVDLAVHSHKDLETNPPKGLYVAAVSEREDPADILLIRSSAFDVSETFNIAANAIVGTSSARRKAQLNHYRNDIEIRDLRGNVPTRIDKLNSGQYDAIVLANAGVNRLQIDLSSFSVVRLDPTVFVPAPAQGVLGLQIREQDEEMAEVMKHLNHPDVQDRIAIERKVLNMLDGGCQLPLGVYHDETGTIHVALGSSDLITCSFKNYSCSASIDIAQKIVDDLKKIHV